MPEALICPWCEEGDHGFHSRVDGDPEDSGCFQLLDRSDLLCCCPEKVTHA